MEYEDISIDQFFIRHTQQTTRSLISVQNCEDRTKEKKKQKKQLLVLKVSKNASYYISNPNIYDFRKGRGITMKSVANDIPDSLFLYFYFLFWWEDSINHITHI